MESKEVEENKNNNNSNEENIQNYKYVKKEFRCNQRGKYRNQRSKFTKKWNKRRKGIK